MSYFLSRSRNGFRAVAIVGGLLIDVVSVSAGILKGATSLSHNQPPASGGKIFSPDDLSAEDLAGAIHVIKFLKNRQMATTQVERDFYHQMENSGKFLFVPHDEKFKVAHHLTPRWFLRRCIEQMGKDLQRAARLPQKRAAIRAELKGLLENDFLFLTATPWTGKWNAFRQPERPFLPPVTNKLKKAGKFGWKQWGQLQIDLRNWTANQIELIFKRADDPGMVCAKIFNDVVPENMKQEHQPDCWRAQSASDF